MLLAGCAVQAQTPKAAALKPPVVQNPYWGSALFEVYQDKPFTALTQLMASQQFQRVPLHADEAEVLRGGLLLDYGLHTEAARIFARLIEQGAPPAVQDRAWFYLARMRWQKGLTGEAEQALARIGANLPPELRDQQLLLKSNVQMARQDFAGAAQTLADFAKDSPLQPYARFNLGVARIKGGDLAGGSALLEQLGAAPAASEDVRSLRDKANVALGFAALQSAQAEGALTALERVRLAGPQSNAALLGFGWASLQKKEPKRALVAFRELSGRPLRDAPALESQIAEAYATAEAGSPGLALQAYEKAIDTFTQEASRLDQAVVAVRQGVLIEQLIGLQTPAEMPTQTAAALLRVNPGLPQAAHLAPLLAQHELQEALKNLRDLRFASGNLAGWAADLVVFDDMLAQRRDGFERRAPQVKAQAQALSPTEQDQRLKSLVGELDAAATAADGLVYVNEREQALKQRIEAVRAALPALDAAERDTAAERLRMAEGALTWHLAREHSVRHWPAQQALAQTAQQLTQATARSQALEQAQKEEPQRLQVFAQRIAEIRQRIAALAPQVAVLANEQQKEAQELAVAELERQKERLAGYTAQARWAVAQLMDRARVAQATGAGHATR